MGAPMEAQPDFLVGNRNIGRHVNQIAEDLARLSILIAAHAAGHDAIEAAGQNQKGHVEIHLKADRRGERIDVEEADRIGKRILDEHALGVAQDQVPRRGLSVVGEQNRRLVMAEILDEELAAGAFSQTNLLFEDLWVAVFPIGDIEIDGALRHGVEVEVEGLARKDRFSGHLGVPTSQ
jgi:hypothetical protein